MPRDYSWHKTRRVRHREDQAEWNRAADRIPNCGPRWVKKLKRLSFPLPDIPRGREEGIIWLRKVLTGNDEVNAGLDDHSYRSLCNALLVRDDARHCLTWDGSVDEDTTLEYIHHMGWFKEIAARLVNPDVPVPPFTGTKVEQRRGEFLAHFKEILAEIKQLESTIIEKALQRKGLTAYNPVCYNLKADIGIALMALDCWERDCRRMIQAWDDVLFVTAVVLLYAVPR
ncbi:hypothetical protein VKT23_016676 [Stygiomarasmius scandens]|uniref:Sesquiterpene synthase n=1 Tax=Marasmiellus scandens TaxID=2682957 RepID=A0ABR1IUF1_9AGAR